MNDEQTSQLLVRNIPSAVKRKLKQRAARYGRSMEELARDIIADAMKDEEPAEGLGSRIARRFRGIELEEDIPELRGFTIEPQKFD
jgi:plasmid stability protein